MERTIPLVSIILHKLGIFLNCLHVLNSTATPSFRIKFWLQKKLMWNACLGEASMTVENLLRECDGGKGNVLLPSSIRITFLIT